MISNSTETVNVVPMSWRYYETTSGTVLIASNAWMPSTFSNWPAASNIREAEEPPRKPTGKIAGKLPVPVTLRAGDVVHRDAKPENTILRAPRMRRPHARGQGPK